MPKNRIPAKFRKHSQDLNENNQLHSQVKIHTDRDNPLDRKNIAVTFPDWVIKALDSYGSRHRSVVVRNAIAWFESTGKNHKDYKDPKNRGDSPRISISLSKRMVKRLDRMGRGQRSYYLRVVVTEYLKNEGMC